MNDMYGVINGFSAPLNVCKSERDEKISLNSFFVPRKVFFTKGVGKHEDELVSFELALRDAGIEKFNLVPVSSIFPPGCEIVQRDEGLRELLPGQVVFCVMARMTSGEAGRRIFASVGAAIPGDPSLNGYLTEYHGFSDGEDMGDYSEKMAAYMLETAFNIKPERTFSITAEAEVDKKTTVVAAAVFIF